MARRWVGVAIICYILCNVSIWLPAFLYASKWGQDAVEQQLYSFSYLNQIGRDWQRSPFESLIVTDETSCPDSHPEVAFTRPWYGSDIGCDCLGFTRFNTDYNLENNYDRIRVGGACSYNQTAAGCRHGEPHNAIIMGQFQGKRICGAPLSTNFLNATRPNLNGECPFGFAACNMESMADNIYCMEILDPTRKGRPLEERCPIVDLQIVKKADLNRWYEKHGALRSRNLQEKNNPQVVESQTDEPQPELPEITQSQQVTEPEVDKPSVTEPSTDQKTEEDTVAETTDVESDVSDQASSEELLNEEPSPPSPITYDVVDGWSRVDLTDDLVIFYTKKGDKLPLTTFSVDVGEPCMDVDSQVGTMPHTLELNKAKSCPLEKITGLYSDPRYNYYDATIENSAFQLTEQGVLEENGVHRILKTLPSHSQIVNVGAKRQRKLQFNTRNTIPWKLECERKGLDREYGLQSFKIALRQDTALIEAIDSAQRSTFPVLACLTFASLCCGSISVACAGSLSVACLPLITTWCIRLVAFLLATTIMQYLSTISQTIQSNMETLEKTALKQNDCSDPLSTLDMSNAIDQMEESSASVNRAIAILSLIYVWIWLECCIPFTFYFVIEWKRPYRFGGEGRGLMNRDYFAYSVQQFKCLVKAYTFLN